MKILQENDKAIDTSPICYLITEGEKDTDIITITVERFHDGIDLSTCTFVMRGVNSKNETTEQILQKRIENNAIVLLWKITEDFTAVPGKMKLEIRGVHEENLIIKYQMKPITIHCSPSGTGKPLPDIAEQILSQMQQKLEQIQEWNNNWGNFTPGTNNMYPNAFNTYYVPSADGNTRSFAVVPRLADLEDNALSTTPMGLYVKDFSDDIEYLTSEIQKLDLEKASHDDFISNKNIVSGHIDAIKNRVKALEDSFDTIDLTEINNSVSQLQVLADTLETKAEHTQDIENLEAFNDSWGGYTPNMHSEYPMACETHYIESDKFGGKRTFAVVPKRSEGENNALVIRPDGLYAADLTSQLNDIKTDVSNLSEVKEIVFQLQNSKHTHSNKSILDGITSGKVSNWNTAYTQRHTHINKDILDSITAEKIIEWDTKLDADNSIGKLYPGSTHGEIFNDYENNKATGTYSAAMGTRCTANGNCSFAMGAGCTTSGYNSIAMGGGCTTNGNCSFTMGGSCIASGDYSHAEGQNTKASSLNQHVQGKYNVEDTEGKYAFVIGNGISENERSNAIAIDWSGNIYVNNSEIGVNVLDMSNLLNDISERTITLETSNNNWGDYSPSHNTYPLACETHYIESEKYSGKKTFAVEIRTSSEENNAIRLSPNGIYVEDLSPQIQALETSIGDIQTVLASIVEVAR